MKSILLIILLTVTAQGQMTNEHVVIDNLSYLSLIQSQADLTIDHVTNQSFEVYGPVGLEKWLKQSKINYLKPQPVQRKNLLAYPSPEEISKELQSIHESYPQLTELISIGKSVQGRPLWVMRVTNLKNKNRKPKFSYIANMHGDEIVGRHMMLRLLIDLTTSYETDSRIKNLINSTDIYIMPSMNPDGANVARRGNANNRDLNRNFPDFTTKDDKNTIAGRQPETISVMNWLKNKDILLSSNFHGGAEVVNYPWDTAKNDFPHRDFVVDISHRYANRAPYIKASKSFKDGITNGYKWYEVDGGMQDWSYYYHGNIQVTVELSNQKWPDFSKMDYYYSQNRESLLDYIKQVHRL